jgi:hypothetical protein
VTTPDSPSRKGLAREVEAIAFRTVAAWVGERGVAHDTSNGHGPDFTIDYHDGRTAIGEVGRHAKEPVEKMWAAINKQEQPLQTALPPGSGVWVLSLEGTPNMNDLLRWGAELGGRDERGERLTAW